MADIFSVPYLDKFKKTKPNGIKKYHDNNETIETRVKTNWKEQLSFNNRIVLCSAWHSDL